MKGKIILSSLIVLLLSISAEAQVRHKKEKFVPTRVVYVNHPVYDVHPKHYRHHKYKKSHKKRVHTRTVVVAPPPPRLDVQINRPGRVNVDVRVVRY